MSTTEIEQIKNKAILVADGSSATANVRAVEPLMGALFSSVWEGPILTTFYPCDSIGRLIKGSPYELSLANLWPGLAASSENAYQVVISLELAAQYYQPLFGDPITRARHLIRRAQENGDIESGIAKARKYLSLLPATLFVTNQEQAYPAAVLRDRKQILKSVTEQIKGRPEAIHEENALGILESLTTNQVLNFCSPETHRETHHSVAFSWKCADCSLGADEPVAHVVRFNQQVYKSNGVTEKGTHAREPRCVPYQNLKNFIGKYGPLFDQPIGNLIQAGFKPSGKLIYLAEAFCYQNPDIVLAIRSYSDPRGTIDLAKREWKGPLIVTPRVYIYRFWDGISRDATGYELVDFLNNGGVAVLSAFANSLPLLDDGQDHRLVIPQ